MSQDHATALQPGATELDSVSKKKKRKKNIESILVEMVRNTNFRHLPENMKELELYGSKTCIDCRYAGTR